MTTLAVLLRSLLLMLLLHVRRVDSHARLECPPPLSSNTGEKSGPCDSNTDNGSVPAYPLLPNAFNTITWLESIPHPGAPARFALSNEVVADDDDGDDLINNNNIGFESCILLDHVPHDARALPNYLNESSYHRSSITLWIPDVYCERCYLQLISIMSDQQHGVPTDTKCIYQGAAAAAATGGDTVVGIEHPPCPAVYHSCSPVSIQGTIPRNDIDVCNTTDYETKLQWPLTSRTNPDLYQHSVYYNRGDVGLYTATDAKLSAIGAPLTDDTCTNNFYCDPDVSFDTILTVPENAPYTSLVGTCAAIAGMRVEPYQPGGILPSVPKEEGAGVVAAENIELVDDADDDNDFVENTTSPLILNDDDDEKGPNNMTDFEETSNGNRNRSMLTLFTIDSITVIVTVAFMMMET